MTRSSPGRRWRSLLAACLGGVIQRSRSRPGRPACLGNHETPTAQGREPGGAAQASPPADEAHSRGAGRGPRQGCQPPEAASEVHRQARRAKRELRSVAPLVGQPYGGNGGTCPTCGTCVTAVTASPAETAVTAVTAEPAPPAAPARVLVTSSRGRAGRESQQQHRHT
jgi:hypothetical protein